MEEWKSLEGFSTYQALERFCDEVWDVVTAWKPIAQETVGRQLIRAADSIGANLIEGEGRYHHKEKLNFCYIARGSLKETNFWLRRAKARGLIEAEQATNYLHLCTKIGHWINSLISQRRQWLQTPSADLQQIKEDEEEYLPDTL
jgi:four helix bundle protein